MNLSRKCSLLPYHMVDKIQAEVCLNPVSTA